MLDSLPMPLWQLVAGVVGALIVLKLIGKIMSGGGKSDQFVAGACACGWNGQMSKYRPVCPKCGSKLNPK